MATQVRLEGHSTGEGSPLRDAAVDLLASHRQSGRTDIDGLAAALRERAKADPGQAETLAGQIEARLSPVERGALQAALASSASQEGVGAFLDGAVRGDFSDNDSWSKLAGQTAMGFVPIAGQIADARDTAHALGQVWRGEEGGWLNLGASVVGWIPGVGDAAKSLIRGGEHAAQGVGRVATRSLKAAPEAERAAVRSEARVAHETEEQGAKAAVKVRKFEDAASFNDAANHAAPNTRYEYGDYSYTTDAKGRVDVAEGRIGLTPTHRNDPALQAQIGREGRTTDIGFHIIGDRFGAQTNRLNVVPGNGRPIGDGKPNLNQGDYKRFENTVAKLAENPGNTVDVRIQAQYKGTNAGSRPDSFQAQYRVNGGVWRTQTFVNK